MSTFQAGQLVNIKQGATEFLKAHGYHEPEYMPDSVDGMKVTVLGDFTHIQCTDAHYEVQTQLGTKFGIHPDYLEAID